MELGALERREIREKLDQLDQRVGPEQQDHREELVLLDSQAGQA